jgi:hypothetical protein
VQQSRVTESHANTSCVDNLSEVMNTGYSEGDGGIMYLHASLVKGYGMHIRENFLHHSLDVPGLIGRHAIQFDDHFGACPTAREMCCTRQLESESPPVVPAIM